MRVGVREMGGVREMAREGEGGGEGGEKRKLGMGRENGPPQY